MGEHTPGPWRPWFDDSDTAWSVIEGEDGRTVASFIVSEQDAKVIAAAPDLLAALEAFVRAVEGSDGWEHYPPQALVLADARAAITRAEGEET